jgi:hypothetical protein
MVMMMVDDGGDYGSCGDSGHSDDFGGSDDGTSDGVIMVVVIRAYLIYLVNIFPPCSSDLSSCQLHKDQRPRMPQL